MEKITIAVTYDLKDGQDGDNLVTGRFIPTSEGHPYGQVEVTNDKVTQIPTTIDEAIQLLGKEKFLSCAVRMLKLDVANPLRESAKSLNEHSTRIAMTEEQKAQAKAGRQADKELLAILKSKGLSLKDLMDM